MLLLPFTDEELRKISEESQTFAEKIAAMAARKTGIHPGMPAGFIVASKQADAEAAEFFRTIFPKNGLQRCVVLVREWASKNGIHKYSTLSGAKRLALQLSMEAGKEQ